MSMSSRGRREVLRQSRRYINCFQRYCQTAGAVKIREGMKIEPATMC